VEVPPPVPTSAQIIDALQGTWRGDGGGAGMGAIVVTVSDDGGSLTMRASPTGCGGCALAGCRWESAVGPVNVAADGKVTVAAVFASCPADGDAASVTTRGSLSRNVMHWSPATLATQWVKNSR
jgi:hypothetical protein